MKKIRKSSTKNNRLVIVSNRLPVSVSKQNGKLHFKSSSGGLATAMSSLNRKDIEQIWIGWPGIASNDLTKSEKNRIIKELKKHGCVPVFLDSIQVENFYYGYANDTLWPLFHYFPVYTKHQTSFWAAYKDVNEQYNEVVAQNTDNNSTIWIHDYHLMLLPGMVRQNFQNSSIGFFLHTPFPSYEIFRLLPHRKEVLEGLLGCDLVGFHIYDYVRHFFVSTLRLLGLENKHGIVRIDDRYVKADSFPIGVDYKKFEDAAKKSLATKFGKVLTTKEYKKLKIILSVDRLDYSKGIIKRLEAFEKFLENNPKYHKKVKLIIIAVPSRTEVETYQDLKTEIDIKISHINGKFGMLSWTPISYHFRNLPFEEVVALYARSDIALVTPLRDGMNLVAKEFVASKINHDGVLILSEMAGAADELQEALCVNPNDVESIVTSLRTALEMPKDEQKKRIKTMQDRISTYTVQRWGNDFLEQLLKARERQKERSKHFINKKELADVSKKYKESIKRVMFFDYDGTLKEFTRDYSSSKSAPPKSLIELLKKLTNDRKNRVFIISGRPHKSLEEWFGKMNIDLVAEHGAWIRTNGKWKHDRDSVNDFKPLLLPIFDRYTERTPGAKTEEKTSSIVWHYRKVSPELAYTRRASLRRTLENAINKDELAVYAGNKIVEVKAKSINKGEIVDNALKGKYYDFILTIGDDYTDEDMFKASGEEAISIKVGHEETLAKYKVRSVKEVIKLLNSLTE